mgnify:CR=1 FL=1
MIDVLDKKGEQGISLTISIADEMNKFQQNVDLFVNRQRNSRRRKHLVFTLLMAVCFWSNSSPLVITKQMREEAKNGTYTKSVPQKVDSFDDLPF